MQAYPTDSGPADHALFVRGKLLDIMEVEEKGVGTGTQNVLEQAKRFYRKEKTVFAVRGLPL